MKAPCAWIVWAALATCAVLVLGAMAMLTRNVRATQHEHAVAEARANMEEQTRLALWRMDAAGAAILLRENQRPPADYDPGNPVPSLPFGDDPLVKLHFEVRDGILVSPEANGSGEPLEPLRSLLARNGDTADLLRSAAAAGETAWRNVPKDVAMVKSANPGYSRQGEPQQRYSQSYQEGFNEIERANRAKNVESQAMAQNAIVNAYANTIQLPQAGGITEIGSMRPAWIDGELFLLRQLTVANARVIQGVWLDAAKLRDLLLAEIIDLLPAARLEPLVAAADDPLVLVSFPFRLARNESPAPQMPQWSGPLLVGWAAVFCALGAVSILVHGLMRLSERRASFVSAVTHELRTPLTTFRLYSDMLETGAVKPEKRGDYLRVLSREADRLSHLVENVLAFSRIERGSARSHVSETSIDSFLASQHERWSARLATAGLELVIHPAPDMKLRADLTALEHILFNLIDNAAKYAAGYEPPQVEISARADNGHVVIEVADHGPGIPAEERRRIFRPFHKSAREAADTKPGVGLGLALSLRLARELGGSLALANGPVPGARFLLRLPVS
ncbi:MAG TPA: HAMP domain-containing sensor histidine kinase [Luteolibacter sp.]|nr:HAMP domain-containing sensor histidine kinase [Luteolibacter sp.]